MEQTDKNALPRHVGIIMDGNGRWAQQKNLPRTKGHEQGLTCAKEIVKAASDLGLPYLTLYVFSTENWKRTEQEVGFLMGLIHTNLRAQFSFYKENGIRLKILGDKTRLPEQIQKDIQDAEKETGQFEGLTVCLAINYGARDEIIRAVRKSMDRGSRAQDFTETDLTENFDLPELPDMDFLIRTGGEQRLSNFMLWHAAYAELLFTDTLWPDYNKDEFYSDIAEFQKRNRRFGGVLK